MDSLGAPDLDSRDAVKLFEREGMKTLVVDYKSLRRKMDSAAKSADGQQRSGEEATRTTRREP